MLWAGGVFRNFSHYYVKLAGRLPCYPLSAQDKRIARLGPMARLRKVECCFVLRRVGGHVQFVGPNSGREVAFSPWWDQAPGFRLLKFSCF